MIICPDCGKTNEKGSRFCHSCGADLRNTSRRSSNRVNDSSNKSNLSTYNGSSPTNYRKNSNDSSQSHRAFYDFSANSGSNNSSKSKKSSNSSIDRIVDKFKGYSLTKKIITSCCAVFLVLALCSIISSLIFGGTNSNTDALDYSVLDVNDDSKLDFSEVKADYEDSSISNTKLNEFFNKQDSDNDGYLAGSEYNKFVKSVNNYLSEQAKKDRSNEEKLEKERNKTLRYENGDFSN